jgi:hypothetical protein
MAKKSNDLQSTPLPLWSIYRVAHKAVWMGEVEAADECAAIEKAAEQFKLPATRLMAMRRQ